MYATKLKCRSCDSSEALGNFYACQKCGGILEVIYDYDSIKKLKSGLRENFNSREFCLWRYRELLPIKDYSNIVSVGEGGTPLVPLSRTTKIFESKNTYMKLESCNPSGSFKDRPNTVAVSKAVELNGKYVIIASSGNAGGAAAAYAARAGLKCLVCVPEDTPNNKVSQALSHGAQVVLVKGSYSNSYNLALQTSLEFGFVNLTSTFLNPYTVEGDKTLAYEIWEQLNGSIPEWVIIPIGAGPLLVGAYKGFEELKMLGLIDKTPKMIGVQSTECSPIVDAFLAGDEKVKAWDKPSKSVASGIIDPLVGYEEDGTLTKLTIEKSGGTAIKVTDDELIRCANILAKKAGIFVEPAAAAALAALEQAFITVINPEDTVVIVMTGHGLKTPQVLIKPDYKAPVVESVEDLKSLISL